MKIAAFTALLAALSATVFADSHSSSNHGEHKKRDNSLATIKHQWNTPDHPDWFYLNQYEWWQLDPTQQDHARFHAYLSMSAYGNYKKECPSTFTGGFKVLEEKDVKGHPMGQSLYTAKIPEMDKIVVVFKGNDWKNIDWTPVGMDDLVKGGCQGCTVAKGVKELYLLAKKATNDFSVAKKATKSTGLKFSVTGHGIGGSVAALAAIDLGSRGWVHYAHNQGMPRSFNYASAVLYDNLFQVLAGQSMVNRNDYMVSDRVQPMGAYYHLGSKGHMSGDVDQWLVNCWGNNENATCLGDGSSTSDHLYYWTKAGKCGSATKGF